jgi:biotin carboxyl carrier protein
MIENNLENATAIEIVDNLKALREKSSDSVEFINSYIDNLFYLLKAKYMILLESKDNSWSILNSKNMSQDIFNNHQLDILTLSSNALKHTFAYERFREKIANTEQLMSVAFRLQVDNGLQRVVFFIYEYIDKNDLNNQILKTQLINDIPMSLLKENSSSCSDNNIYQDLQYILNLNTDIINIKDFKLACNTIVNDIATKFDFDKVSLATYDKDRVKIISISHTSEFEKGNRVYDRSISMFEESILQDEDIIVLEPHEPYYIIDEHKSFYMDNNLATLITLPIRLNDKIIGAIQAYSKSKHIAQKDVILFRLTMNKVAPILSTIKNHDISVQEYLINKLKESIYELKTPKNALVKSIVVLVSMILFYIMFFSYKYEVSATSILSTDNKASISTPFNGIINNIFVKVGDKVQKGQNLFSLDIEELRLKELESKADIIRYQKEKENFMSQRKLADMEIANAKVLQAKSKLQRIEYKIQNSTIKSTISGTIVQGDKEKLLGMPIAKGDTIFYISNSTQLYLQIKIPEDEIYHINKGQKGKVILLSDPLKEHNFTVSKVIPKAEVDSANGNVYIVYGILENSSKEWWHPGMSGVVKIDTGPKNIFWILTHKVSDFLRLYFW